MPHRSETLISNHHEFLADDVFGRALQDLLPMFHHHFPNSLHDLNLLELPFVGNQEIYKFDLAQLENQRVLAEVRNFHDQNLKVFQFADQ
jgi:hypothetical protein